MSPSQPYPENCKSDSKRGDCDVIILYILVEPTPPQILNILKRRGFISSKRIKNLAGYIRI